MVTIRQHRSHAQSACASGHSYLPSQRFLDALARGEVTRGGLAEAGWFDLGVIGEDGITLKPNDHTVTIPAQASYKRTVTIHPPGSPSHLNDDAHSTIH